MKFQDLRPAYEVVVVGGGVTGAGAFLQATAMGLRTLLVEAADFAWGTSSRSSKMVHGGLRYLKEGKFLLTRSAVKERERLLALYPGLVNPLEFIMPVYAHMGPSERAVKAGLSIYSAMAGTRQHRHFNREAALGAIPGLRTQGLNAAVGFRDAQVDDARLVLRLIFDGCEAGGHALNYTKAVAIGRDGQGRVRSLSLKERDTGREKEIQTPVVINATGPHAEILHASPAKGLHIRPLRGSHLIFPGKLFPLTRVISFAHPRDSRPVFLFPWEGSLVLGTTDVDFNGDLDQDPAITPEESDYLLEGLDFILPDLGLNLDDALASIAGVRPVLSKGKKSASGESREHVVWKDKGLVTVTGGKLTTFSLLARDALKAAAAYLPGNGRIKKCRCPDFAAGLPEAGVGNGALRLRGRHGNRAGRLWKLLTRENSRPVGQTATLWAELEFSAGFEQVRRLEDLMLRRTRIGLLLPRGGMDIMDDIRARVCPYLGWDHSRWEKEIRDYRALWKRAYAPVPGEG
ncbi:MAG: glycerol-3-phosphate dehydrogenase/oxidase [Desulfobacter sp.]|nr:MAG: glycerol-3-phosphate dehydrogenase/oxidase [Desulfobacter sp.]